MSMEQKGKQIFSSIDLKEICTVTFTWLFSIKNITNIFSEQFPFGLKKVLKAYIKSKYI